MSTFSYLKEKEKNSKWSFTLKPDRLEKKGFGTFQNCLLYIWPEMALEI